MRGHQHPPQANLGITPPVPPTFPCYGVQTALALIDGCNSSKQHTLDKSTATNSMRPLKSAIAHFKFAGQLLQRDIDKILSNTSPLASSTSDNLESLNSHGKEKILRDVLEFDAFVVNFLNSQYIKCAICDKMTTVRQISKESAEQ